MALETAATIAELNPANPIGASDAPSTLDDHIRLLKTVLQADALVNADVGTTVLAVAGVGSVVQAYDADIPTVAASQGEMEAGTEAALRSMSPLRVAQAITAMPSSRIIQVVHYQTGALATGTTILPNDDTIPQITEGDEYLAVTITPTSATNKLLIEVVLHISTSVLDALTTALFQDSTANALAVVSTTITETWTQTPVLRHYMTSGTTSATTFRIRAGCNSAGTTTLNGYGGARKYGGVSASSITVTEIKA